MPVVCHLLDTSDSAATLVHHPARLWRILELQLAISCATATVSVLPQRLSGHSEGARVHHLCGEGPLITAAE